MATFTPWLGDSPIFKAITPICACETEKGHVGLPGMENFLSPIYCKKDCSHYDLSWVPKGGMEQLLIKGEAAKKAPEARLKGPEKLIRIRSQQPEIPHTPILSETLTFDFLL